MPTDVAVTYMAGSRFCRSPQVMVYVNSIRERFDGDRLILTHEMAPSERAGYSALGFEVIDVPPPEGTSINRGRWRAYYDALVGRGPRYRYAFLTDCRDVLWQCDPVPALESVSRGRRSFAVLCGEGMRHRDCDWNSREQTGLRLTIPRRVEDFADWHVVNGGVQAGTVDALKDLAFSMYCVTLMSPAPLTDQGFLNLLYHTRKSDPGCGWLLADPSDSSFAATGNSIARGLHHPEVAWRGGRLVGPGGAVYPLFHQWDRTAWRAEVLARHGGSPWADG